MHRRDFLKSSLAGAAGLMLSGCASVGTKGRSKKILVLGGTNYLGPAIVERALAGGHEVTLFNRGITRPELFPDVEKLRGTRHVSGGNLDALQGRRNWDAVIDVWPAESSLVRQTADLLADRTSYYFFVSSIGVYADFSQPGLTESSAIHANDPGWYGGEKAIAEQFVTRRFPARSGIARCHAILGPRDDGVAFHYWLRRLAHEEVVLAPGTGNDPVQFVDVRDVADWIVSGCEIERAGTFNLCGPQPAITFRAFLESAREAIGSQSQLVWVDADFLRKDMQLRSFSDFPLWAPIDEDAGFYMVDGRKALAAGIQYRPRTETARDAWRWYQSHFFRDVAFPVGGSGMSREKEIEVLGKWAAPD